jgi:hypothetical protein
MFEEDEITFFDRMAFVCFLFPAFTLFLIYLLSYCGLVKLV